MWSKLMQGKNGKAHASKAELTKTSYVETRYDRYYEQARKCSPINCNGPGWPAGAVVRIIVCDCPS
jgi:hypothetical protein